MAKFGETTTTTTTETTGAAPVYLEVDPNSNSTVDQAYGCCITARIWTIVIICLKFIAEIHSVYEARTLSSTMESARETSQANGNRIPPEAEAIFEMGDLLVTVMVWTALPFLILYTVSLIGAITEKMALINFYILLLCLEKVFDIIFLAYFHSSFQTHITFVVATVFWSLIFNVWAIFCAVEFRKRVALRKSQSLQSEPTAFYSA